MSRKKKKRKKNKRKSGRDRYYYMRVDYKGPDYEHKPLPEIGTYMKRRHKGTIWKVIEKNDYSVWLTDENGVKRGCIGGGVHIYFDEVKSSGNKS